MENKELQKLTWKLGEYGTLLSSLTLLGCTMQEKKVPLITIGILSLSLIGSNLLLVKSYKYKKIIKEQEKVKKRK